ncbi:MAG: bifunctional aldolase/short-chain dehydrogenase, partial [Verrucomicrobiota bacterium]
MQNRWNPSEAPAGEDLLAQRVYSSRLLGAEPDLVLHGGGNTSVKITEPDFFGESTEVIYVKGSGWDLATIEKEGFAPVRMDVLLKLGDLETLGDAEMVKQQRAGMLDPAAPNPSIEAILHAIIPFKFVDHTHADAVVALTNTPDGEKRARELYGDRVLYVPYVMPGFVLAKAVQAAAEGCDWSKLEGMVLMNHGIFSWADDAQTSYDRMVSLVSEAEEALAKENAPAAVATGKLAELSDEDYLKLAEIRKAVSEKAGTAMVVQWNQSEEAVGFASREDAASISRRGPLTPDHVIRTKRVAAIFDERPATETTEEFERDYDGYFSENRTEGLEQLDAAPRWAVWKDRGILTFGKSLKDSRIVGDLCEHTARAIQWAEALGGWSPLPAKEIFDIEYWELEQAKLKKGGSAKPLQGKVAVITGGAAGIGLACAESLYQAGACVAVMDLNPESEETFAADDRLGIQLDLTNDEAVKAAIQRVVAQFGGIDILVSNAGIFTAGAYLEDMEAKNWEKSLAVNLTSHQRLLQFIIPFLKQGVDASAMLIGSRNVAAPGAGAAAYSCPKAAQTQLTRVAALELAPHGVRVNIIHPDAVFDTKLW